MQDAVLLKQKSIILNEKNILKFCLASVCCTVKSLQLETAHLHTNLSHNVNLNMFMKHVSISILTCQVQTFGTESAYIYFRLNLAG